VGRLKERLSKSGLFSYNDKTKSKKTEETVGDVGSSDVEAEQRSNQVQVIADAALAKETAGQENKGQDGHAGPVAGAKPDTSSDAEIARALLDPGNVGSRAVRAEQSRVEQQNADDAALARALEEQGNGGPGGHPDTSNDEALARALARQEYGGQDAHAGPAAAQPAPAAGAQHAATYPLQENGGGLDRKDIQERERRTKQRDNDIGLAKGMLNSLDDAGDHLDDAGDQNKAPKATLAILTALRDGHASMQQNGQPNNADAALNQINHGFIVFFNRFLWFLIVVCFLL
jgi:hypothetical protein